SRIDAVDPSAEQIEYAKAQPAARSAHFQVGDAQSLPFPDAAFDVVASALVLNFVPDRPRALAEMRRVARPGGLVAGYVWDFAGGRSTNGPLGKAMRTLGIEMPAVPGTKDSSLDALKALFRGAGLDAVEARPIEITPAFAGFDEMWTTQVPAFSPMGKFVASLPEAQRQRVKDTLRGMLPPKPDGSISYAATANAVKGRMAG